MSVTVSIIIPTYNRANVLPRALKSVFAQTYQDFEIIVVNDCSKDNTDEVMAQFSDPRIRYIKHETNKGGNAARNTGIKASQGEFVAFLDSDDEWLPGKLEKQIPLFNDQGVGLVYCGLISFDHLSNQIGSQSGQERGRISSALLAYNCVGPLSTIMVRKRVLIEVEGFDELLRSCQDWDLYIRISKLTAIDFCEQFLLKYYINKNDQSRISNSNALIIKGHEAIKEKFQEDYKSLPLSWQVKHFEYFMEMHCLACDWIGVFRLGGEGFLSTKNFMLCVLSARLGLRAMKRKLLGQRGY